MASLELQIIEALVEFRNPLLNTVVLNLTAIGSIVFAIVLGAGLYRFDKSLSYSVLVSGISSFIAAHLVKILVMRPRPPVDSLVSVSSYAFPSGHAAVSFGLATVLSRGTGQKFFYVIASLVGFSRLYLGVHYPSDVLFGAALGYIAGRGAEAILERI